MTEELTSEKFLLRNLDCAACAAKIEQGLNQRHDLKNAVVDFASLTLHVKTRNVSQLQAAVKKN